MPPSAEPDEAAAATVSQRILKQEALFQAEAIVVTYAGACYDAAYYSQYITARIDSTSPARISRVRGDVDAARADAAAPAAGGARGGAS